MDLILMSKLGPAAGLFRILAEKLNDWEFVRAVRALNLTAGDIDSAEVWLAIDSEVSIDCRSLIVDQMLAKYPNICPAEDPECSSPICGCVYMQKEHLRLVCGATAQIDVNAQNVTEGQFGTTGSPVMRCASNRCMRLMCWFAAGIVLYCDGREDDIVSMLDASNMSPAEYARVDRLIGWGLLRSPIEQPAIDRIRSVIRSRSVAASIGDPAD